MGEMGNIERVFGKRINGQEQEYLVKLLGEPRSFDAWTPKARLVSKGVQPQRVIAEYDALLEEKARKIGLRRRKGVPHIQKRKRIQRSVTYIPTTQQEICAKRRADIFAKWKSRKVKDREAKQRKMVRIEELAMLKMREEVSVRTIPSESLCIRIATNSKFRLHWAYGDRIVRVCGQAGGQYEVEWEDGSRSNEEEDRLLKEESERVCEYFEEKMNLRVKGTSCFGE